MLRKHCHWLQPTQGLPCKGLLLVPQGERDMTSNPLPEHLPLSSTLVGLAQLLLKYRNVRQLKMT